MTVYFTSPQDLLLLKSLYYSQVQGWGDSYQKVGGAKLSLDPRYSSSPPLATATYMHNIEALEWTHEGKTGGALPPQF